VGLDAVSPLNGVFVEGDGSAWAVGMLGQVMRRSGGGDGAWTSGPAPTARRDWHAVWVDSGDSAWVVGGDLLTRLDQGTLVRYGPPRADLPSGEVGGLEPLAEPASEVTESEVVEPEPGPEVVEPEPEPELIEPQPEIVEMDDADVAVADVEVVEVVETVDTDVAESDAAAEVDDAEGDTGPLDSLEIGWTDYSDNSFHLYENGDRVGIQHGPQGGIHLEITVRFPCETDAIELATDFDLRLDVNRLEVARFVYMGYPVPVVGPGICRSYALPVVFDHEDASIYAELRGQLHVGVSPPGQSWQRTLSIELYDTL
jgi:hypothetical protein